MELKSVVTPVKLKDPTGFPIGVLSLDKPSGVPGALKWARVVCLDLLNPNDAFSLRILMGVLHPNILRLESVIAKDSSLIKICVEEYTDSLYYFVKALRLKVDKDIKVIQNVVRQIVEGIHELISNGLYHGNFIIETTYYNKSTKLVKLANFQERGEMGLEEAQYNDWHAVGDEVEMLSLMYKNSDPSLDYSVMDNLAHMLKSLSPSDLPLRSVKDSVLGHVFFWNTARKTSFFIYDIQGPLHSHEFKKKVEALQFISDDWNQDDHGGLLAEMNKYRIKNGLPAYKNGKHQYILFVSGCYTHEHELRMPDVDVIITKRCPHLCLELVKIVRELGYTV